MSKKRMPTPSEFSNAKPPECPQHPGQPREGCVECVGEKALDTNVRRHEEAIESLRTLTKAVEDAADHSPCKERNMRELEDVIHEIAALALSAKSKAIASLAEGIMGHRLGRPKEACLHCEVWAPEINDGRESTDK